MNPTGSGDRLEFLDGQWRAMESLKRFILVLAGWQSGKSEVGPPWLLNEMCIKGPGDYLVASPTYPLMEMKVLPIFRRLFEGLDAPRQLGEKRVSVLAGGVHAAVGAYSGRPAAGSLR